MIRHFAWSSRYLAACALLIAGSSAHAGVIYNAENQPVSITDLQIGDVTYHVAIEYGGSFEDHFGDFAAPSPLPAYWGSENGATSAVTAIAAALNAETPRPTASTMLMVPTGSGTWPFGDYVDAKIAEIFDGQDDYTHSSAFDGIRLDPHIAMASAGWTTFRAVPEPSSIAISSCLGLGAVGMTVMRRRQRGN